MDNKTIQHVTDKADRWFDRDDRIVLTRLVYKQEKVASFPIAEMSDEAFDHVTSSLPELFEAPKSSGKSENSYNNILVDYRQMDILLSALSTAIRGGEVRGFDMEEYQELQEALREVRNEQ